MIDVSRPSRSQRKAVKQLHDNLSAAMEHGPTRYVLRWVLDAAGLFASDADRGSREVALGIVAQLNEIDPHLFVRLMQEGADDIVRRRNEARGVDPDDGEDDDDVY